MQRIKKTDFSTGTASSLAKTKQKQKKKKGCYMYFTSLGLVSACCVSQQREGKGQSLNSARCLAGSLHMGLNSSTPGVPHTPWHRASCLPQPGKGQSGSGPRFGSARCHGGNWPEEKCGAGGWGWWRQFQQNWREMASFKLKVECLKLQ